jgi:hypothetical protein
MKTEFTKGEWKMIFEHYPKNPKKICVGVGTSIKMSGGVYSELVCNSMLPDSDKQYIKERKEIEANMRLIASAPELLDALNEILANVAWKNIPEQQLEFAKNAIKKATE